MAPLNVAQLMNTPGGPGVVGAIKSGTGVSVASDGALNLNPPTSVDIGGVRAGSNITISPDGVISAADAPTGFLPLSGGTMTGVLTAASGTVREPSIQFEGAPGAGFYYRDGTGSVSVCANNNAVMQWDDDDQCITGDPNFIPAGARSPFGGSVQSWTYTGNPAGSGFVTVRASSSDSPTSGDFKVKRCSGPNPFQPQPVANNSVFGGFSAQGCNGSTWNEVVMGLIAFKTALSQNNTSQLNFYTDRGDALTEWVRIGPVGNLQPVTDNSVSLGNGPTARWTTAWLAQPPIVGINAGEISSSPLQSGLGLGFINSLTPIQYVPDVEYNDVYGVCQNPTDPADDWVWENSVTPVPGTTAHWGVSSENLETACASLGLTGNLGVFTTDEVTDEPNGVRLEELVAPLILAVQQLSDQYDDLRQEFDNYVATHP